MTCDADFRWAKQMFFFVCKCTDVNEELWSYIKLCFSVKLLAVVIFIFSYIQDLNKTIQKQCWRAAVLSAAQNCHNKGGKCAKPMLLQNPLRLNSTEKGEIPPVVVGQENWNKKLIL